MDDLEKQLKSALSREAAPAWLEARVMNAINAPSRQVRQPRWQWVFATVMVTVIAVSAGWEHHRVAEERAAGEAAKAKLQLALKITGIKLEQIQRRIDEAQRSN
jgi:hypothetical protein